MPMGDAKHSDEQRENAAKEEHPTETRGEDGCRCGVSVVIRFHGRCVGSLKRHCNFGNLYKPHPLNAAHRPRMVLVWIQGSGRTHRKSFVGFAGAANTYCRMHPTDDSVLLRQYVETRSDEAFATLVSRHVNLVYSVAKRCVGDPHQAEEIAQSVFILLANKAATLPHDEALSSWLFQTTRLTAANFIRRETRRHRRELEAHMQSQLDQPDRDLWQLIAPLLDDAVAELSDSDRRAVLLRFYEGRSLREVDIALGVGNSFPSLQLGNAEVISQNPIDVEFDQLWALGPKAYGVVASVPVEQRPEMLNSLVEALLASGQTLENPSQLRSLAATSAQRKALENLVSEFNKMSTGQQTEALNELLRGEARGGNR